MQDNHSKQKDVGKTKINAQKKDAGEHCLPHLLKEIYPKDYSSEDSNSSLIVSGASSAFSATVSINELAFSSTAAGSAS